MPRIALQPGPEQGAERAAIRTKGAGGGTARHSTAQHVDHDPETECDIHEQNRNIFAPGWAMFFSCFASPPGLFRSFFRSAGFSFLWFFVPLAPDRSVSARRRGQSIIRSFRIG